MITTKSGKVKPYKEKKKLRPLAEPFVVAPPGATSSKTRIRTTGEELDAVLDIGMFLGSIARQDLVTLLHLEAQGMPNCRTERKQNITGVTSSRWAGGITRTNLDQYDLAMRNLQSYQATLRSQIRTIEHRLTLPLGPPKKVKKKDKTASTTDDKQTEGKKKKKIKYGYRDKHEKFYATRKLGRLYGKLAHTTTELTQCRPSITIGGKGLLKKRHNLTAANLTEAQWGQKWGAKRMFLTADGDASQHWGNGCIWIDPAGHVHLNVPAALVPTYGKELVMSTPVEFSHRGGELRDRICNGGAISYVISYEPEKGKLYITASWKIPQPAFLPTPAHLKSLRHLAVDLNGDHLAAWVVDKHGNPVGAPIYLALNLSGLPAAARDAQVRHVITTLIKIAKEHDCAAIVIEDLDFVDIRSVGKEQYGKGFRGKKFRKTVLGMPTAKFRDRLVAMCYTEDLWVIAVDPAYTSKWGKQHWLKPLQKQQDARKKQTRTSQATVTGHMAAAVCVGRRSHGYPLRRKDWSPSVTREMAAGNSGLSNSGVESVVGLTVERKNLACTTRGIGHMGSDPPL